MATRLFKRYEVSEGRAVGGATERSLSRALAKLIAILGVLALLLPFLVQNAFAQPTVIATISFGASRAGVIAANPVTNRVYAVQSDLNTIAVIDGSTNTILTTVPTSGFHCDIDVNPVTNLVYVSQAFAGNVRIIDGATNNFIDLPVPSLIHTVCDLAVNPATNRLYVIRHNNNDVAVFDASPVFPTPPNFLGAISLGLPPTCCFLREIAVNPSTNRIYVANAIGNKVIVIDGATNFIVAQVSVNTPHGIGVNPATNRIYVSDSANSVSVIDGASNAVVMTIPVGSGPFGVGVNPATNRIYVANNGSNNVSVVDGATNTVVATVPVGLQSTHLAVVPSTSRIYVANDGGHSVSVIEDLLKGTFSPTGSMGTSRGYSDFFTLTRLCDGRVLAAGGHDGVSILSSAEIYHPASGTWTPTGFMTVARYGHSATLLADCRVLVAGGNGGIASAELYDPTSGTWSPTGSLSTGRAVPTAVRLNTGEVLVAAGAVPGSGDTFGTASAELYNPALGTWSTTGSLVNCGGEQGARYNHVGVLLSDGRVLIAGGMPRGVTFSNFASAQIYDRASGTWSCTGSMAIGRRHGFTLTLLPSGKVLVAGGTTNWTGPATNKAELYDPTTGSWTPTTPMPTTQTDHSATLLLDGTVLVAGGRDVGPGTVLNTALIYDPVAQTWSPTAGTMAGPRYGHLAVRLLDGRVLIVGGSDGVVVLSTAELFGPPGVPCTIVTNLNDSGPGSLRAAITCANSNAGPDTITFAVAGTINVIGPSMTLSDPTGGTRIDGATAPGYAGAPVVALRGPGTGSFVRGLLITSAGNEVRALQIGSFSWAIEISGPSASGNVIVGNYLGTDGTVAVDALNGVVLDNAPNNRIGTDGNGINDTAERNVISGNSGDGVRILGSSATGNVVSGNYIGTNATGTAAVPNLRHGIILLAPNNRIGTDGNGVGDLAERNIISGNRGAGVSISSSGNVVAGNYIGTDVTGTTAVGNATFNDVFSAGVILHSGNNRVGTNGNGIADAAERNVISGNNFDGVKFNGASDNVVAGNYIGTNAAGTAAIPNARFGVFAGSGTNHRIGTDGNGIADEAERNVISGNTFTGVFVQNSSTVGTIIAGNYIGTDAAGTAALGNNGGISVGDGASNTRIGTDGNGVADAAERNVISGNNDGGVGVAGGTGNVVVGNYIGTDATGMGPLGNRSVGVSASGNVRIGSNGDGINDAAESNIISYNGAEGVVVFGAFGGGATVVGNTVSFNGGRGVVIRDGNNTPNKISRNSISVNGGLGIDLSNSFASDGVTPNDTGDGDTGANNLQNFPVLTSATSDVTSTTIGGTLNSTSNTTFRLEFFHNSACDPSGFGEGETFLGSTTATTDGTGNVNFVVTFPTAVPLGRFITATATDPNNNTSEFSRCITVMSANQPPTANADGPYSVSEGTSVTLIGSGSDPNGDPLTFAWDLDNNGTFETPGQNVTFLAAGRDGPSSQTVVLQVCDNKGACATSSTTVNINNVAPAATFTASSPIDEGGSSSLSLTGASDRSAADVTAGFRYSFACDGLDSSLASTYATASTSSTASCVFDDNGSYTVKGRIFDKDNGFTTYQATVVVNNVAPTITAVNNNGPIDEGSSASISVTASDPAGVNDPLSYEFDCNNDGIYEVGRQASNTAICFFGDNGSFQVNVRVSDGDGGDDTDSTTVAVNNVAPTATFAASSPINEGGSSSLSLTGASDPSAADTAAGFRYSFACDGLDGSLAASYALAGTTNSATCSFADNGSYTVKGRIFDKDGGYNTYQATVVVNNVAPMVDTPTVVPEPSNEGSSVTASATFNDPGSNDAPFTCTVNYGDGSGDLPGTVSGNTCTGPIHTYADNGSYTVMVKVTDKDNDTGSNFTTHQVNNVTPTATLGNDGPVNEGSPATVSFSGQFDPSSADATAGFHYAFSCTNGDLSAATYTGSGTSASTSCTFDDGPSTHTVKGRIIDKDDGYTEYTTVVTVNNVAPTATFAASSPIDEGSSSSLSLSSPSDPSSADTATGFRYSFACDGQDTSLAATYAAAGTSSTTSCAFDDNRSYTVKGRIFDKDSGYTTYQATVVVNNVAPTATFAASSPINEGGSSSLSLSNPSDPSNADTATGFRYSFACDGQDSSLTTTYAAASTSSTASCAFDDNGSYTVKGRIFDKDNGYTTYQATVVVNNVAPTATLSNDGPVNEGSAATISFSNQFDPSSADTVAGFHYAYDCDNDSLAGATYASSGTSASTTCTFIDNGSYTVRARIIDKDDGYTEYTTVVIVNNVAPVITSLTLSATSISENDSVILNGSFTDAGALDNHTVVINWGDSLSTTIGPLAPAVSSFSASHQYLDDNPTNTAFDVNTISVTVIDKDFYSDSDNASATVNNVAPAITSVTGPSGPLPLGSSASVTATFTDVGSQDTHTCTFSWDDGTLNTTVSASGMGNGSCTTSHTYAAAGVYTVMVTVTDDDTGTATSQFEFVVVYDPSAGFVTGGGWIYSNPGAYKPVPELEGKATFGFVSKYKKGANVPTGNTEFQFHAAGMNFHSDTYEWLVVTGSNYAMFKGVGTINGGLDPNGNAYKFMLWAGDGSPDTFRIRIWWEDTDSTEHDVYDNGFDQAIGGGSIVIHTGK